MYRNNVNKSMVYPLKYIYIKLLMVKMSHAAWSMNFISDNFCVISMDSAFLCYINGLYFFVLYQWTLLICVISMDSAYLIYIFLLPQKSRFIWGAVRTAEISKTESLATIFFVLFFFFSICVFSHNHSRITGL